MTWDTHCSGDKREETIVKNKFISRLSWIFFGNVVHAVLQFALNIVVARMFGDGEYGLINYAAALIAFFTSIGTLGFNGTITKHFAEDETNAGDYLASATVARVFFAVVSIALLQVIVRVMDPEEPLLHTIVLCQSMSIFFGACDLFIYWFRFKDQAKHVAVFRLVAFMISAIWRLYAVFVQKSITYYVAGVAAESAFFMVQLIGLFCKQYRNYKLRIDKRRLLEMLKISYPFICSALLATIYGQTDKVMLKSMVGNSAVGHYSVAQTLAGAIVIIPTALIEAFRPDIMSYKICNERIYRKKLQQLYGLVFWMCTAYCIFITMFKKQIIYLLYGTQYLGAVPSLGLIVWYTSFSYFGAINNLYMVAEGKTVWVQLITLLGAILNVLLNLALIPSYGIVGAAAASLVTQIIANFVLIYFIKPLRKCFFIMVEGIFLKGFSKEKRS